MNYDPFSHQPKGNVVREILDFGFSVVCVVGINVAIAWVAGSTLVSTLKHASDDCGSTYKVESVLAGDWFCPEEVEEGAIP